MEMKVSAPSAFVKATIGNIGLDWLQSCEPVLQLCEHFHRIQLHERSSESIWKPSQTPEEGLHAITSVSPRAPFTCAAAPLYIRADEPALQQEV